MKVLDADAVRRAVCNVDIPACVNEEQFTAVLGNVCEALQGLRTIPLIRCCECKYWDKDSGLTARECDKWGAYTKQFDYCSYGEARACG